MNDRMIKHKMQDIETGEEVDLGEYYFLPTGFKMTTIVLIKDVESYDPYPDGSIQIDAICKALDSAGMVFDTEANFTRHSLEEKTALLLDITTNSVHIFCGQYGVDDKGIIALTQPDYRPVEPDFNEDEVREAFRINEQHIKDLILLDRQRNVDVH